MINSNENSSNCISNTKNLVSSTSDLLISDNIDNEIDDTSYKALLTPFVSTNNFNANSSNWSNSIGSSLNDSYYKSYETDDNNIIRTISYTKIDGCEEVVFIKQSNILKMSRKKKLQIKVIKSFPFIEISNIYITDLSYIDDKNPKIVKHIYSRESPTLIAKKFGLSYEKTSNVDLVNDDLEAI